jgi:hypothetical protein
VLTASIIIALVREDVRTSETSVNFNVTTGYYIPEDSELPIRRRENLKSHTVKNMFCSVFLFLQVQNFGSEARRKRPPVRFRRRFNDNSTMDLKARGD